MLSGWDSFGAALYQLGELHRLRGAFDEAEEAYRRASQAGRQLGDEDATNMEFAAAQAVFEELGAGPDLEPLRQAREPTPVGKAAGGLTKREVGPGGRAG
jgi:hypothetical protein